MGNMIKFLLVRVVFFLLMTVPRIFGAWSADVPLTFGPTPAWYPSIACDNLNRWNVVFQDTRAGPLLYNTTYRRDIFYKRYNGTNWTSDVQVSAQDYYNGSTPDIVYYNGYLYATWADEASRGTWKWNFSIDIFFSRSADGGLTWSVPFQVSMMGNTYGQYPSTCNSPKIAVSPANGNICIIWMEPTVPFALLRDIKAAISSDTGKSWSTVQLTSASGEANTPTYEYPAVKADNIGNFFAVWNECASTSFAHTFTWLRYSRFNGVSWSAQSTIASYDSSPGNQFTPSISIWMPDIAVKDTNHLYVVFTGDYPGPARQRHVYFMCSTNGAASWTTPVMISTAGMEADVPKILYDPFMGGVRVVFEDKKHYISGDSRVSDVVMATSTDNGKTWTTLTLATGYYAGDPRISENSSGGLAVTWEDNRTDDWCVYLKTGP